MSTTEDDAKLVAEIRQILERMVMPELDAIKKQLADSIKRVKFIEAQVDKARLKT